MTSVEAAPERAPGRSIRRAALLSGVLIAGGTGLGFVRDLVMAHLFGASGDTDAFLVAWTIPETVSPLLIEDAMALVMVPAVTRLLGDRGGIRPLVSSALPRLAAWLAAVTVLTVLTAPWLVRALAPGLAEPGPAVRCVRLTALTVLTFGVAGFMSATLRAHHRFGPPAAIYLAYNAGILAMLTLCASTLGVTAAALGVACGGLFMVAVQTPAFITCVRSVPKALPNLPLGAATAAAKAAAVPALELAAIAPIVVYTVVRQAQVFVERFLGAGLAEGSISCLNYAQKVAQVPMVLSLLVVTVTFPRLARSSASGDTDRVRRRVEADLVIVSGVVLVAAAYLIAFAPAIVALLFEHGRFTPDDAHRTALILRVYTLGLWGQAMVGVAARAFFARGRPMWEPARALAVGLAVTVLVGAAGVGFAGTLALAAANAAGITVSAVLMLAAVRARVAPLALGPVAADIAKVLAAAAGACGVGLLVADALGGRVAPLVLLAAGGGAVASVFAAALAAFGRGRLAHSDREPQGGRP
ncbi:MULTISPECIES: lipid II flippase MurJ [Thermomonosporaceae]|uniref:lipid II flippase MurJ n=1 Tax=Thermomonosporaceae TaxID=2012 RepID=UPI00255A8D27|nr:MULTISPECIES: lipid II flippase MurJ [Thermomonosporaceae]MDL4773216.1 lipid II flippase MurJ [Actinomadura xylanilytica]